MRKFLALALLALAACGSSEEKTTIGDVTLSNDEQAGISVIETATGSMKVVEGPEADKLEMPAFAPKYPGSIVESAIISTSAEKGTTTTVNFSTKDSLAQIAEYYEKQFEAQGLKLGMKMVTEESIMVKGEADGKRASVIASIVDGKLGGVLSYSGQ